MDICIIMIAVNITFGQNLWTYIKTNQLSNDGNILFQVIDLVSFKVIISCPGEFIQLFLWHCIICVITKVQRRAIKMEAKLLHERIVYPLVWKICHKEYSNDHTSGGKAHTSYLPGLLVDIRQIFGSQKKNSYQKTSGIAYQRFCP